MAASSEKAATWGRAALVLAVLALLASLVAGFLLFTLDSLGSSSAFSAVSAERGTVVTGQFERSERSPDNELVMQFWGIVVVLLAVAVLHGVRGRRLWLAWVPAGALFMLSILGALSIGFLVAPVAILSLAAAAALTVSRPPVSS